MFVQTITLVHTQIPSTGNTANELLLRIILFDLTSTINSLDTLSNNI